jgi:hypothetical protein
MTAKARVGLALSLSLMSATGCRDDLSEVVLVVDSDLIVPTEVDGFDVTMAAGPIAPPPGVTFFVPPITEFPLSVGFVSLGETTTFSFVVRLFVNVATMPPEIVASRTVSDVRFAGGETVMLRLSLPRVCACHGTSCPLPGNPACDNLQNPRLEPFDPDKAPPSTMMTYPVMVF